VKWLRLRRRQPQPPHSSDPQPQTVDDLINQMTLEIERLTDRRGDLIEIRDKHREKKQKEGDV